MFRFLRKALKWLLLALAILAASAWLGRVEWLARAMVTAQNYGRSAGQLGELAPERWRRSERDRAMRFHVGPPAASLSALIFDPPGPKPRATILVLHGIRDQKLSMVNTGHRLADLGYRVVLLDSRGHGRSTGNWLTFGVTESLDLSQVLDALDQQGLLAGEVGIYGASYGAATAVQAAGHDPRIRAIVAVACFSSLREVVPDFAAHLHLARFFTPEEFERGLARAGEIGGFDPALSNPAEALHHTSAHVLLLHGTDDTNIPPSHARRNLAASEGQTQLVLLPGVDHVTIFHDASGELWKQTTAWFNRWLAP